MKFHVSIIQFEVFGIKQIYFKLPLILCVLENSRNICKFKKCFVMVKIIH